MDAYFCSRIDDICARADRGELACSPFYNESEAHTARDHLNRLGRRDYLFYGGFEGAERTRLFVFPYWLEPSAEGLCDYIRPVLIKGSGYVKLDHRSYLGALTSAGISRDVIGDIVLVDDASAVVMLDPTIAKYLTSSESPLERIGRDKVSISPYTLPHGFGSGHEYVGISGTVASLRLDCMVSELTDSSREKTKAMISQGLVMHNYDQALNFSAEVREGDIISVRGYGKYRVDSIGDKTKKDRTRFMAVKYK